jgi:hypothetical protein
MSYRTNDIFILVGMMMVGAAFVGIGLVSRWPGFMEEIWWLPLVVGGVILLGSLITIGFVATQPTKISCPYCHEKIVPKVGMMSGHLRLSRLDED